MKKRYSCLEGSWVSKEVVRSAKCVEAVENRSMDRQEPIEVVNEKQSRGKWVQFQAQVMEWSNIHGILLEYNVIFGGMSRIKRRRREMPGEPHVKCRRPTCVGIAPLRGAMR